MATMTPEAIITGSTTVESAFPNYARALREVIGEHDVALSGLAKWSEHTRRGTPLDQFLARREAEIRNSFSEHSQRVRDLIGLMPQVVEGLTDLGPGAKAIYDQARAEPDLEKASAVIDDHFTDEKDDLIRRVLKAGAIDPRLYDQWLRITDVDEGDALLAKLASGKAAREALLSARDGNLLDLTGNRPAKEATRFLRSHGSRKIARLALQAAYDLKIDTAARSADSFQEASRLYDHASDNMNGKRQNDRRARAKTHRHNINGERAEGLSAKFSHRTLEEELAFELAKFRKQFKDMPDGLDLTRRHGPLSRASQRWLEQHKGAVRQWEKIERRITKKYPKAQEHAAREANEQAEARRQAAEEAAREAEARRRQAEAEAEARRQARQQQWDNLWNQWSRFWGGGRGQGGQTPPGGAGQAPPRGSQAPPRSGTRSGQTPPRGGQTGGQTTGGVRGGEPPREPRPPRKLHFPETELKTVYDEVKTRIRNDITYHQYVNTFESYEKDLVIWVIDRIIIARRESAKHGMPISDRKLYEQFLRLGGAGVANPSDDDKKAAQLIGTLMAGKRNGELPFKHGLPGQPFGPEAN